MSAQDLLDAYPAHATAVTAATITPTISRDPADDAVLACALAARADLVVSGDAQLLNLERFHSIENVVAAETVKRVAATR